MRNREIGLFLTIFLCIWAGFSYAGFQINIFSGWVCVLMGGALIIWSLLFTAWRYRQIKKLSAALAIAAAGAPIPCLRTNKEGELSILQNDIYKLTTTLAGKAEHFYKGKEFLANTLSDISHQLKTPLTSLLVLSDLLQEESLPIEKRKEFLQRVSAQLERLRWLVSSLLQLSRLDAEVVTFRSVTMPIHSLLNKATEPLLSLAEQKNVAISVHCPRQLSWTGDPDWTQEALTNLLKNCIEHTAIGTTVTMQCVDNPLHTLILIQDEGSGFAPEDLPRIFERFYRGAQSEGGAGIGLAMAKSILQAQCGEVTACNRAEGGACFCVKLFKAHITE